MGINRQTQEQAPRTYMNAGLCDACVHAHAKPRDVRTYTQSGIGIYSYLRLGDNGKLQASERGLGRLGTYCRPILAVEPFSIWPVWIVVNELPKSQRFVHIFPAY